MHFTKYYIRCKLAIHISSEILVSTNKIFQSPIKSFQCFSMLFFFLATSPDLIAQVHAHIQHKHLKKRLSYIQLVWLRLIYRVFRKRWYCRITMGRADVLFTYFIYSRSKNKLDLICCLAKSFKTMCYPNTTESAYSYLGLLYKWKLSVMLPELHDLLQPYSVFRFNSTLLL